MSKQSISIMNSIIYEFPIPLRQVAIRVSSSVSVFGNSVSGFFAERIGKFKIKMKIKINTSADRCAAAAFAAATVAIT